MDTQISTKLHSLADRVLSGEDTPATTATVLRLLAEQTKTAVALPAIDPARDDLTHWRGLSDERLRGENGADAWNLAAGLHVEAERRAELALLGEQYNAWAYR